MREESGSLKEWLVSLAFVICSGWATWHTPAFILDIIPDSNQSRYDQMLVAHQSKDFTPNLEGMFGGVADPVDWLALILVPIFFFIGVRTVRCTGMEYADWRPIDRIAIFIGRVTMMLIVLMTCVMLYEVFLRYIFEKPTLWANELTLWLAGYIFLLSGLYAMQQRCHIRIFLLYDAVPRFVQHLFDIISVTFVWIFAIGLIYGSYQQVFINKFYKWEKFGTAFDPPIPATIQPMILIMVALIAVQALLNLIADWNLEPEDLSKVEQLDAEELEAIKRSVGKV